MNKIHSTSKYRGCDTFSNRGFNRFDPALPIRFYAAADDGGGNDDSNSGDDSGGNNNSNNDSSSNNNQDKGDSVDLAVSSALVDLTAKHGSVENAAKYLIKRNHSLAKSVTPALPKDQKTLLDSVSGFLSEKKLTFDQIKTIVAEHGSWSEEKAKDATIGKLKTAAGVAKLNADLLASLDGAQGVEYLTTGEGDKAVATVKLPDGTVKPLGDWADEKWPHLKIALRTLGDSQEQPRTIKKVVKGAPMGGGKAPGLAEEIKAQEEAKRKRGGTGKEPAERPSLRERLGRTR